MPLQLRAAAVPLAEAIQDHQVAAAAAPAVHPGGVLQAPAVAVLERHRSFTSDPALLLREQDRACINAGADQRASDARLVQLMHLHDTSMLWSRPLQVLLRVAAALHMLLGLPVVAPRESVCINVLVETPTEQATHGVISWSSSTGRRPYDRPAREQ
jgi:hypothetical protein